MRILIGAQSEKAPMVELTYNWPDDGEKGETYDGGRNFGHLAYVVDDIYATCKHIADAGITINRPPRDGYMAFVKSPEGISIELLQKGSALEAKEPWSSMENTRVAGKSRPGLFMKGIFMRPAACLQE